MAVLVRGRGAVGVILAEAFLFDFLVYGLSCRVLGVHFGLPRVGGRMWFPVLGRGARSCGDLDPGWFPVMRGGAARPSGGLF